MKIRRSRIRNLENYIGHIPNGTRLRVVVHVTDDKMAERIGLGSDPGTGETILPAIVGPVTRFNSEGRWIVRKDLPKEIRYVRTVSWSWTEWNGDEHEDFRDIYRECYQRDLVPPPSVELTYVETEAGSFIVSPSIERAADNADLALHTINVFLELFRSCDIASDDLSALEAPVVKHANWKLLPTGQYPWDKVDEHVGHALKRVGEGVRDVILDRQQMLKSLKPDECWVGEGGFDDYMAYVFHSNGLIVLESLRRDNAIYLFKGDWRPVSRLTKAQIIQGGLHHARIVHTKDWKGKLTSYFQKRAA